MSFHLATTPDGLTLGRFSHVAITHGIAGRTGGFSTGPYASLNLGPRSGDGRETIVANRRRFHAAIGATGLTVIAPRQVHGAVVSVHRRGGEPLTGGVYDGDGLLTDDEDALVAVLAADCAAILLHDPVQAVVGALHAGWRGTAAGIASAGIAMMRQNFGSNPADIRAGIGPAIGRCCYEVGIDVAEAVARATPGDAPPDERVSDDKAHLDITHANHMQLLAAGLDPANVATTGICTACRTDLFYSHRREGEPTGRFGAAISLRPPTG
ncbi:MAG: peptidoglycan editing factor PgeF [Dehalococcoidia bacterium]